MDYFLDDDHNTTVRNSRKRTLEEEGTTVGMAKRAWRRGLPAQAVGAILNATTKTLNEELEGILGLRESRSPTNLPRAQHPSSTHDANLSHVNRPDYHHEEEARDDTHPYDPNAGDSFLDSRFSDSQTDSEPGGSALGDWTEDESERDEDEEEEEDEDDGEEDNGGIGGNGGSTQNTYDCSNPVSDNHYRREDRVNLLNQARLSTQMSRRVYDSLSKFPSSQSRHQLPFDTTDVVNRALKKAAPLVSKTYDYCEKGCMAYTGPDEDGDRCNGPFKYTYISPINRLRAMFENPFLRRRLKYRDKRRIDESEVADVFDGTHFQQLREKNVKWQGTVHRPEHKYFDASTDIALGFSTDGVPLHNRTGLDAWPLVLTIFSLPPEIRYKQEFQLCCGLVPGTKSDKEGSVNFDSFLVPLLEELKQLATEGVQAYQFVEGFEGLQSFRLRAHLITVTGDMPAIAKLMNFKGVNAIYPCRYCKMRAVKDPNNARCPYYMTTLEPDRHGHNNYGDLPLRTDHEIKRTANKIEYTPNNQDREEAQKGSGINGECLLSIVDSLDFPLSFPLDMMHVLFENIVPQLLNSWRGRYKNDKDDKGKDVQDERNFVFTDAVWEEIKAEVLASNTMVPSQWAPYVNPIDRKSFWTAETYSYFVMHLGPIILQGRLPEAHYQHFLKLSEMTKVLVKSDIAFARLEVMERELVRWVKDFERLYYAWDMKYISSCTAPIHAMLHVAACVRTQGPPANYWCFAMERYGGWVKRWAKSNRKQVITAVSNRIIKQERIHQLSSLCTSAELKASDNWWNKMRGKTEGYIAACCKRPSDDVNFVLGGLFDRMKPTPFHVNASVFKAVKAHLIARAYTDEAWQAGQLYEVDDATLRATPMIAYKAYRSNSDDGGQRFRIDTTNGLGQSNYRDASWVTFTQVVDKGAHTRRAQAEWVYEQQWGQLQLFLEFEWEGERLQVAVIQAYQTKDWIGEIEYSPQELGPIRSRLLQVVGVDWVNHLAGRINLIRNGRRKTIIFEPSGGQLQPEEEG